MFQSVAKNSTLAIRIPIWTSSNGVKATLNGQNLEVPPQGEIFDDFLICVLHLLQNKISVF